MTVNQRRLTQHYFMTAPMPCPYLPGRFERKLVTELRGPEANNVHDLLSRAGFRRSHSIAYLPACSECDACVPVRVRSEDFRTTRSFRRIAAKNNDLIRAVSPSVATQEQFQLFSQYQDARHGNGDMARMDARDYRAMIEDSTVDTSIFEYRRQNGSLIAVALVDNLSDGLSAVYSFFDPSEQRRGLGTFIILDLIKESQTLGLPHVYLGYWIGECRKMSYKMRFQPLEGFRGGNWVSLPASDGIDG
ncbi:arginyl-tRNA--protein-N-Asp/Glu arginylyltransferase [Thalassospira sp. MBR-102]|jgi:arginine-tRNA-protein transferase|uniref:Aspartate/glutamate leucyltransferase n=1 Tax=Thalassospira xiamenensis TaxID=220697 RepID=A0ABR5Y411_9PROT|nr:MULTISPECIES: arginyltransferase [Thalassospira]MBR9779309.1 arginyltransferase [Rhodospirillales bacterium]KZD05087.1 arginyl-tRNA-protein transferase [Thalassospira xiamenensis]KZD11781.1 arginyl-tRNA-protein transferase [Thalassospira xiamenensis]MAB32112.1 arginyltransferase [Thalassospira sp.]MAL28613.1 arginyltransferase [Thalassospira sp.]|tara:strand:+ start:2958 stop:3698 length:741 start_codon:yes stop_codon:yes gene_type:complete